MSFLRYLNKSLAESDETDAEKPSSAVYNAAKELGGVTTDWLMSHVFAGTNRPERLDSENKLTSADFDKLVKLFGNKSPKKVYIPINFNDESEWHEFSKKLRKSGEFSSEKNAVYGVGDKNLADGISKAKTSNHFGVIESWKYRDHGSQGTEGYMGIVLQLDFPAGEVVDIAETTKLFGDEGTLSKDFRNRDVVIIPPGSYPAKIIEKHIPVSAVVHNRNAVDLMQTIKNIPSWVWSDKGGYDEKAHYDSAKLSSIMAMLPLVDPKSTDGLKIMPEAARRQLYKICAEQLKNIRLWVKFEHADADVTKFRFSDHDLVIKLGWDVGVLPLEQYFNFMPDDQAKMDLSLKKSLRELDKKYKEEIKKLDQDLHRYQFKVEMQGTLGYALEIEDYFDSVEFTDHFNKEVMKRYHFLNSYEETRRINDLKNHDENGNYTRDQSDEINAHGKKIADVLGQILSSNRKKHGR